MKRVNKELFWGVIRKSNVFKRVVQASAVKNVEAIIDEFEDRKWPDIRHLAYMLATVRGETGSAMWPVRECFAESDAAAIACVSHAGRKYGVKVNGHVYYGRGDVQLTWYDNYLSMGKLIGVDLVSNPDKALEPAVAAKIMFEGMSRGTFTGKKLSNYFNDKIDDPVNARRIINGTDRMSEFASFYRDFLAALKFSLEEATEAPAKSWWKVW